MRRNWSYHYNCVRYECAPGSADRADYAILAPPDADETRVVVILAGTNELAQANGIKVVLAR